MKKISVFEIFKIGLGPSSSHSMGPWNAANDFLNTLNDYGKMDDLSAVTIELFGSLAKTGKGHGTDKAVMMGLMGFQIESFQPEFFSSIINQIEKEN